MKKYLVLILISAFIFSCNKTDSPFENIGDYSQFINSNSISSNIEFMPFETSPSNTVETPTLKLRLKTVDEFSCVNYGLITTEFINDDEFIIRFEEITEPTQCLTAMGPAVSEINLTENIKKLVFINGNIIDIYSINIDNQKIDISLIENNFTTSLYDKTYRYPENSFAFVCGTNSNNTQLYDDFLTILLNNQELTAFEFIGAGRVPYPETSSGHWVNHPSRYFTYTNVSEFESLGQILSDFTDQNIIPNSGVSIRLISWDNRKHLSWIN